DQLLHAAKYMTIRQLTTSDYPALEQFLVRHRDSSMFLRANSRRGGLDYEGKVFQATYAAALDDGHIVGVAGHCWNGMMLLQAPEQAAAVAKRCVEISGRPVTGFAGPLRHVRDAQVALGFADTAAAADKHESLYALDLTTFQVPSQFADAVARCRAPRPEEYPLLRDWRSPTTARSSAEKTTTRIDRARRSFLTRRLRKATRGCTWRMACRCRCLLSTRHCPISCSSEASTRRRTSAAATTRKFPWRHPSLRHASAARRAPCCSRTVRARSAHIPHSVSHASAITHSSSACEVSFLADSVRFESLFRPSYCRRTCTHSYSLLWPGRKWRPAKSPASSRIRRARPFRVRP